MAASRIGWDPAAGCFASRYGPYSSLFHFPTDDELQSLRDWAFDVVVAQPRGRAQFVFGGFFDLLWNADCYAERVEPVDTGSVVAGSLEALGIYLHALADRDSHAICIASWGAASSPPWPTHTVTLTPRGCAFIAHGKEFGCPGEREMLHPLRPEPDFVAHTIIAAERVYGELLAYARTHGREPRVASWAAHHAWLKRQVERFVVLYSYLGGARRRAEFASALMRACASFELTADDTACIADVPAPAPSDFATCTYELTELCQ